MDLTSEGAARIFLRRVYASHGLPSKVTSDRGSNFVAKFLKNVYGQLGVKTNPSTTYHPQTDGLTERANQEVFTLLKHVCSEMPEDWASWLPITEFALNNRTYGNSSVTPFLLDYARHPVALPDLRLSESNNPAADDFLEKAYRM